MSLAHADRATTAWKAVARTIMPPNRPPVILKADGFHMITAAGSRKRVPCAAVFARLTAVRNFPRGHNKKLAALVWEYGPELLHLESSLTRGVLHEGAAAYQLMLALGPHIEDVVSDVLDEEETHDVLREIKAARAAREAETESETSENSSNGSHALPALASFRSSVRLLMGPRATPLPRPARLPRPIEKQSSAV